MIFFIKVGMFVIWFNCLVKWSECMGELNFLFLG
jgi:hypothetical protein